MTIEIVVTTVISFGWQFAQPILQFSKLAKPVYPAWALGPKWAERVMFGLDGINLSGWFGHRPRVETEEIFLEAGSFVHA